MIQITPPQNPVYWISQRALAFSENDLNNPNRVAVSLVSGTVIMVYEQGVVDYAVDGNFRKWTLKGYSTRLIRNDAHYIYARLSRTEQEALIVFSVNNYNLDGSITTVDEEGNEATTNPSPTYFYVKIGELTATDGAGSRELTYDSGALGTKKGDAETGDWNEMFELGKTSTPWLIFVKQMFYEFTVKNPITLLSGLIFKKNDLSKPITDIKRSTDGDNEFLLDEEGNAVLDEGGNQIPDPLYVPVSDENLATSKYVESKMSNLDDKYLSKVKEDETPYHIKLLDGLTTTEVTSDDYAPNTKKAGWAAKKNDKGEWYVEADQLIARMLLAVSDLLVNGNAVFKGNLSSEEFISGFLGGKGWAIQRKEWQNAAGETESRSVAEFDDLIVRGSMRVFEFLVSQMLGENDNRIFTGMMEVDHYDSSDGKIYLKTDGGKLYNPFRVDDVIIVQQYGGMPSEDSGYYVTKQYEFIVTEAGVGSQSDGENRLDWVKFRNFTTPMEGGDLSLITERDTLVRLDNLSDARRKGIIQMMAVGEDTPYMDFIYGAKTDPENSLKGRFGNIGGIYNPLFGWLKEFGAYLTNLYAVGEFRIAHTGEDVADAIEMAKGSFRTNHRQTLYDMTEEENYFTNASMTNDFEHWILGSDDTSYYLVDGLPQFFNRELYGNEQGFSGIAEHNGRDMLRLHESMITQQNSLIRKPGTHKKHTGVKENADGSYTDIYEEVPDTLYLSIRIYVVETGTVEFGFVSSDGTYYENDFHYSKELRADEDAYTELLSGVWDGKGDFRIQSTGDVYIDLLSLTDKPLDNFKIEMSTAIEQTAEKISLTAVKLKNTDNSLAELVIRADEIESTVTGIRGDLNATADDLKKFKESASGTFDSLGTDLDTLMGFKKTFDDNKLTASSIKQTSDTVSLMAGAFEKDGNEYVLTKAAGVRITSDYTAMFATRDKQLAVLGVRADTIEGTIVGIKSDLASTNEALTKFKADASDSFDSLGTDLDTLMGFKKTFDDNKLTASSIKQTSDTVSLMAGAFEKDSSGNYILKKASGIRITEDYTAMFSKLGDTYAKIATSVQYDPKTGKITSKIQLSADQISLSGVVTYSMLDSSLKNTLDSKLTSSDLSGYATTDDLSGYATTSALNSAKSSLNTSISNLNSTLTTKIDAKASISSLNSLSSKVDVLNDALSGKVNSSALGDLAYIDDVRDAACGGSTLVVNGFLNTDYIKVKTIEATKGSIAGFQISGNILTNDNKNSDASVIFRNTAYGTFAGIGGNVLAATTGVKGVARFENHESSSGASFISSLNYALLVSSQGAYDNVAIRIGGGYVSGFAMKNTLVSSSLQLTRNDYNVIAINTSEITITLPKMELYDDGHVIRIKRLGTANVRLKMYYCYTWNTDTSTSRFEVPVLFYNRDSKLTGSSSTLTLEGVGDAFELVWCRDLNTTVGNTVYHGAWIQYKLPRDW